MRALTVSHFCSREKGRRTCPGELAVVRVFIVSIELSDITELALRQQETDALLKFERGQK
jgi:hypothetical protein